MSVGIYRWFDGEKSYVGQSVDIDNRYNQHIRSSKESVSNKTLIAAALEDHFEKFIFEVLEECPIEELDDREEYWIQQLNSIAPNGYNILHSFKRIRDDNIDYVQVFKRKLTKDDIISLKEELKSGESRKSLMAKYNVSDQLIDGINSGRFYYDPEETYPLFSHKKNMSCILKTKTTHNVIKSFDSIGAAISFVCDIKDRKFETMRRWIRRKHNESKNSSSEFFAYGYIWNIRE